MELERALVLEGKAQAFGKRIDLKQFCWIGFGFWPNGGNRIDLKLADIGPVCHTSVGINMQHAVRVIDQANAKQFPVTGGENGHLIAIVFIKLPIPGSHDCDEALSVIYDLPVLLQCICFGAQQQHSQRPVGRGVGGNDMVQNDGVVDETEGPACVAHKLEHIFFGMQNTLVSIV